MDKKIFKCRDFNLDYTKKTLVMGILNVTPDSFSDGNINFDKDTAIKNALQMVQDGADIIDIGGQSTRPNHIKIDEKEELARILPIVKELVKLVNVPISIDTFYPYVASECAKAGASIINDVTGFRDEKMAQVAKEYNLGCVIMHDFKYTSHSDMKEFFNDRLELCTKYGIEKSKICFDPGIGFNKEVEENLRCTNEFDKYLIDGCAMMIASSRKRFVGAITNEPQANKRDIATFSAHSVAVFKGANIVRVHNVVDCVKSTKMVDAIIYC